MSRVLTESKIWPMFTRATVPLGLPQAPRIPVCNLSAPAHDNILLIRTTWYGWARTRRWKPSLPATLTRYLGFESQSWFALCNILGKAEHTCWRRYEQLRELRRTVARIRWRPYGCRGEIHRRWRACGPGRRYGSWGREHHG